MRRIQMTVWILLAGVVLVSPAWAQRHWRGWGPGSFPESPPEASFQQPGFLIVDGDYVPPPYEVWQEGETIFVNGYPLPPYTWQERHDTEAPYGRRSTFREADIIRYRLNEGLLVAVWSDDLAVYFEGPETAYVLAVFLSDLTAEQKLRALTEGRAGWISPEHWQEVLDRLFPTGDLITRWEVLSQRYQFRDPSELFRVHPSRWTIPHGVVALAAICAFLAGLEVLIRIRVAFSKESPFYQQWGHVDRSDIRAGRVWGMVFLLWILNGMDLGFTLLAHASVARFREVNPLGVYLLDSPWMLALFKVSAVLAGTVLLLALRRRRSAEVAAWWVCLVYTVLMFQWVGFYGRVVWAA